MFELLTGRVPFEAASLPMLLVDIATKPATPLLSVRSDVPPALAALVDATLAKDPADRPQTAVDFKIAVEELERGTQTIAAMTGQSTAMNQVPALRPTARRVRKVLRRVRGAAGSRDERWQGPTRRAQTLSADRDR